MGMSQLWVAHLRRETVEKLKMQRRGCPRVFTGRERRCCVTLLGVVSKTLAKIQKESSKNVSDVTMKRALRWDGLAARV